MTSATKFCFAIFFISVDQLISYQLKTELINLMKCLNRVNQATGEQLLTSFINFLLPICHHCQLFKQSPSLVNQRLVKIGQTIEPPFEVFHSTRSRLWLKCWSTLNYSSYWTFLPPLSQIFTTAESVLHTKMSIDDLSMVTAPAILRCPYEDPRLICENMKKEMAFIRTLMTYLDTSFMEDII